MHITDLMKNDKTIKKELRAPKFDTLYAFYCNNLLERIISLFVYYGLPDTIPSHEIEVKNILSGTCGITNVYEDTLYSFSGQYAGDPHPVYYDYREQYSVFAPKYSNILKVYDGRNDGDVVVFRNNSLGNPTFPVLSLFAIMLAHIDVTIIHLLISSRKDVIPCVSIEQQKQAVKDWYSSLANGTYDAILDPAFSLTKFVDPGSMKITSISEAQEMKERVLDMFYEFIGLHSNLYKKKGNMIAVEAMGAGSSALMLNLDDMLDARKKSVELLNRKYGLNVTVKLSDDVTKQDLIDNTNRKENGDE